MRLELLLQAGKPPAAQELPPEEAARFATLLAESEEPTSHGIPRSPLQDAEASDSGPSPEPSPVAILGPIAAALAAPGATVLDEATPRAPVASPAWAIPSGEGQAVAAAKPGANTAPEPAAASLLEGRQGEHSLRPLSEPPMAPTPAAPPPSAPASATVRLAEAPRMPEILSVRPSLAPATSTPIAALQPAATPPAVAQPAATLPAATPPAAASRLSGAARLLAGRPMSGTPQPGRPPQGESAPADPASTAQTPSVPLPATPPASLSPGFQPQQGPFRSDSQPPAPETAPDAQPMPTLAGDQGPPPQAAGPVQDVRLAPGQREGLTILLGVSSEQDRADVQAEAPMLLADLAGVGAKVEAIRVELAPRSTQESAAGWAFGQNPGSGPGAGQPGQEEALARAIRGPAHGDRAAGAGRPIDHGGKVDRYA